MQETIIGTLYIRATALHLRDATLLGSNPTVTRRVLRNLIALNVVIILLDCSLIALCYSGFFSLQGFYKAALYAVKLRAEFSILNALRTTINTSHSLPSLTIVSNSKQQHWATPYPRQRVSHDSDVEMVRAGDQINVRKDVMVSSSLKSTTAKSR